MTHDSFSISRFGKYFMFDLKNGIFRNGPTLLIYLGVYLLVCIFFSATLKMITSVSDRENLFKTMYFVFTTMTPGVIYGHVNDLKKGTVYILLPVTVLEKYLSMLVNCLIFWPILAFFVFRGMDCLITFAGGTEFGYEEYMPLFGTGSLSFGDIVFPIFTFSLFICGNLLFRKKKYGLTLLSLIAFIILSWKLNEILPLSRDILSVLICIGIVLMMAAGYFRLKTLRY